MEQRHFSFRTGNIISKQQSKAMLAVDHDHKFNLGLCSRQLRHTFLCTFLLIFILSFCSLGSCNDDAGKSPQTISEPSTFQHVNKKERGMFERGRSIRRSPGAPESEHGFLPLHQQQSTFMEDSRDFHQAEIWTDPDNHCSCWNSSDGGKVREIECKCNGTMKDMVSVLPSDVHRIIVKDGVNFTTLKKGDLRPYNASLREITLTDLPHFREIRGGAFIGMPNLDTIYIVEMPSLTNLSDEVFKVFLPKLKTIRISHSSLTTVPNLSRLSTLHPLEMVDLENNKIERIEPGWLGALKVNYLALSYNKLEEIGPMVFNGSTISRLTLKGNRGLRTLHPETFFGIAHLSELDLSETAITQLPVHGLSHIEKLRLQNVLTLSVIPSIYHFQNLKEAWMTFPYHCCAFEFPETHNPQEYAHYQEFVKKMTEIGCGESGSDKTSETGLVQTRRRRSTMRRVRSESWSEHDHKYHDSEFNFSPHSRLNEKTFRHRRNSPQRITSSSNSTPGTSPSVPPGSNSYNEFDPYVFDPDKSFGPSLDPSKIDRLRIKVSPDPHDFDGGHSGQRDEFGVFHESVPMPPSLDRLCGNVTIMKPPVVRCHPLPDAFSPCEDIMGNIWLRGAVWVVVTLALVGNTAVLVVLLLAPGRMSVQRFLMANLSWADLCMGIYLLMVATEDLVSLGAYFNHAISWQLGWGCQVAGFFTVFASELSVFTLAIITGERWYALTRAMHLTKRLTIINAAELMSIGWICSIALAVLPLLGVSSYSKTSICLPMEATTAEAQGYLAFLLVFNGVAFTLVACAYFQMYRAVAGHASGSGGAPAAHSADAAIAKKMALLVFTDFACWAPVAFFGLTAVAGVPLIGVTDSKILLVFFYPLNACCNPYLYAILTKQYRRDLLLLLSRHGICTRRAARYKTGQTGSTNNTMHTMQTILRLGSVAETKVGNGGRISVTSMGGQSLQSGSSMSALQNAKPGATFNSGGHGALHEDLPSRSQKISVCSIASITERDMEDEEQGRLLAETSFISVPLPLANSEKRAVGKAKHVRISTDSSPDSTSLLKARLDTVESFGYTEHEASESTPFCSP